MDHARTGEFCALGVYRAFHGDRCGKSRKNGNGMNNIVSETKSWYIE
jgi:hypothetical protein